MSKPHISPSQIEMFSKCPEQWRRRYIEGEKIPPGIAAVTGSGVHGGISENFRQKIESHRDLPEKDIIDAAVATFEERLESGDVTLTPDEQSAGRTKVLAEATDRTAKMAGFHARQQAPDYQPVERGVEQRVVLPIAEATHDLLGVIDLLDDQHRIADFKTAARSKQQSDADTSIQLTVYSALVHVDTGKPPSAIRLDSIVSGKRDTRRQVLHTSRGPDDYRALAARVNTMLKVIQSGVFAPTSPGNWYCSKKYCGYANTCCFYSGRD